MSEGITILTTLKSRYIRIRMAEIALLGFFIMLIVYSSLLFLNMTSANQIILTALSGMIAMVIRVFQVQLHKTSEKSIAAFLNTRFTELNASAELILMPMQELPVLGKLQQMRTLQNLKSLNKKIDFPNRIRTFSFLVIGGLILLLTVRIGEFSITPKNNAKGTYEVSNPETGSVKNPPTEITRATVSVSPPAYTKIRAYSSNDLNLVVQENSKVSWTLTFSGEVNSAAFINASRDTIQFLRTNNIWQLTAILDRNGFYQLVWNDGATHTSEYFKITIIPDQPPLIKLENLNQFIQINYNDRQSIEANPILSDDYGLTDAYIVATVSKGSGESVKFREEQIRFSTSTEISGRQVHAKQLLNLKKLGLEPGDELYFYVEAFDNRLPKANRSRTETYFISIPDTAQDVMTSDGGLGVDLMPEYFRSQRQIIIDTEKLIRERKIISKKQFDARSNELGYDQKVLRLRYGQFMGEEADSGIATEHEDEHDEDEKPEDIIKEFGHQHDTENEHNLVEEKDQAKKDVDGGKKENLLEDFIHQHDNEESATFFFQSLKLKLKAALTQMWDAELYLRLYEPEKSLPYQYTALRLLKEISNDSRIYVHRTGFEPPPIKEEKRLTAELNEVFSTTHNYDALIKEHFPKISEALRVTEKLLSQPTPVLVQADRHVLLESGSEFAREALENPSLLPGLNALNELSANDATVKKETLRTLRKYLWLALPKQPVQAGKNNSSLHELDRNLIRQLELLEQ